MTKDIAEQIHNWTLKTDTADIAWLGLRTADSTNVLSRAVLLELDAIIDALETAPPAGLILFSHKETGFIAGADVREFPNLKNEQHAFEEVCQGQQVLARLEKLPFTTVAVINGVALGGGLELALACNWRISFPSDRPTLGLPEVQLGVHPGLGGTIRTVRLAGVRTAMQLMLTGKPIRPHAALSAKLIDNICEADEWRTLAAELALQTPPTRSIPLLDQFLGWQVIRPLLARTLIKQTRRKANPEHYPAPFAIIKLWHQHGSADSGFIAEAHSFAKLVFSRTSANLQRVFFLQDRMKDMAKAGTTQFRHVHVVGAGTMGADIAAWCALQGISVTLQDREKQFIDTGLQLAHQTLTRKLKKEERIAAAAKNMVGDLTGEGAHSADLIIEAIFEDLEAKQKLFVGMERRAKPDALLATNTSSIPLEDIASALTAPERLIGLHFFNPVALMPLVEVVHAEITQPQAIENGLSFVKQIGKLPLPCRSLPGFLVNRILAPYLDEACRLYTEGTQPEAIDKAATDFGMPVGPLELADTVGLDILLHVATILSNVIHRPIPQALAQLVAQKHLGRKSGQGFYSWQEGKAVTAKPTKLPASNDVQARLILSLINEAFACIADKVVSDADLVDAGTIFGAGFAPFRGGPVQHAREMGLEDMRANLKHLYERYGERFAESAGWATLANKQSSNS
ncbi:MAG: crotonase [Gammaproteobacteria bacterium]|nr:crotonase [Gammaproteobacteria bacterium]MCP4090484.1 crotonase [Gammaproteobacteria bacterium]MCP4276651.1 crotonase [Gammaproteobacteria bacterium]MCP4831401.1 crotonase [Gammaproteobacteria bacterium]MCP4927945.1 crotonase [Gammaproteobacteria bacterium]